MTDIREKLRRLGVLDPLSLEADEEIGRLRQQREVQSLAELQLAATNAKLREQNAALLAALEPLLEHYLNCYDGSEDELAKRASAALTAAKIEMAK